MPNAILQPCTEPGCPALVKYGRCPKHRKPKQQWVAQAVPKPDARASRIKRGYDRVWQKLRRLILDRDCGRCRQCGQQAKHVDHIVPKRMGGTNVPSNLQSLCASCHSRKTRQGG